MNCPHCNSEEKSLIKETRLHEASIARKRECSTCGRLFVTRESVDVDLKLKDERSHRFFKRKTPQEERKSSSAALYSAWGIGK